MNRFPLTFPLMSLEALLLRHRHAASRVYADALET